jgi:hypothetical protein
MSSDSVKYSIEVHNLISHVILSRSRSGTLDDNKIQIDVHANNAFYTRNSNTISISDWLKRKSIFWTQVFSLLMVTFYKYHTSVYTIMIGTNCAKCSKLIDSILRIIV